MKFYLNNVVLSVGVEGLKSDKDLELLWDDLADGPNTSTFEILSPF